MSQTETKPKKVTITATLQRRWDAEQLSDYRERMSADEQFMARHRETLARGKESWVDCHNQTIAWVEEGCIQIGRQRYAVGPVEEGYHLRCICVGCPRDTAYCQVNHQVRIANFTYDHLRRKARAALLPDGAVIRFSSPFDFGIAGKHDTFRKGQYTYGARKRGHSRKQTVFHTLDDRGPYRIMNWQCFDWEIVSLPEEPPPLAED